MRLSIRARLTIWYAALFAGSGAALLAGLYWAMRESLPHALAIVFDIPADGTAVLGGTGIEGASERGYEEVIGEATANELLRLSALAFAVMLIVSVALGWLIAGRVLAPVHVMSAKAARMSIALDERFDLAGPKDELRELADTFDLLLDRLQRSVASERRLVANVSHELKTPLATQRAILEIAIDDDAGPPHADEVLAAARAAIAQNERATEVIRAMATLARAGDVGLRSRENVDLSSIARRALDETSAAFVARTIDVSADLDDARGLWDRSLVERMVDNLVVNAATHTNSGGRVWVSTKADDGASVLVVESTGPELSEQEACELTLPFRRGGQERTGPGGQGLGLSIVAAIARAHGADLSLVPRAGGGLVVTVRLPA